MRQVGVEQVVDINIILKALQEQRETLICAGDPFLAAMLSKAIECVRNQDAKEIIHCQACRYSDPCGESYQCLHPYGLAACSGVDYCSYGKRKDEDISENNA